MTISQQELQTIQTGLATGITASKVERLVDLLEQALDNRVPIRRSMVPHQQFSATQLHRPGNCLPLIVEIQVNQQGGTIRFMDYGQILKTFIFSWDEQ